MSTFVAGLDSISAQFKQAQDILDQLLTTTIHEKTEAEQVIQNSRVQQARQASEAEALLIAVRNLTDRDKETQANVKRLVLERDARDANFKQVVLALFVEKEMKDFDMRAEVEGLLAESSQAHRRMEEAIIRFSAATGPASQVSGPLDALPSTSSIPGSPVVPPDIPCRANEVDYLATPQTEQSTDDSWVVCEGGPTVEVPSSQTNGLAGESREEAGMPTEKASRLAEKLSRPAVGPARPGEGSATLINESSEPALPVYPPPMKPLDLTCRKSGSFPSVILAHIHDEDDFGISVKTSPNSDGDVRLQKLECDMSRHFDVHPGQADNFVPADGRFQL